MQAPRSLSAVVVPFRKPKRIKSKKPTHKPGVLIQFPSRRVVSRA